MTLKIYTTGGTIDKMYFDANSAFEVGDPQIGELIDQSAVDFDFEVIPLMRKDSLELTDEDRESIRLAISKDPAEHVLVTHGTDTMVQTAKVLKGIQGKTIVLTGSLQPLRFRVSDGVFNIGFAVAAVQLLAPGVYIAMHGRIFDPSRTVKNVEAQRFEENRIER